MNAALRAVGALLVTGALLAGCAAAPARPVDRSEEVLAAVEAVDGVASGGDYVIEDGMVELSVPLAAGAAADEVAAGVIDAWSGITVSDEFGLVLVLRREGVGAMRVWNADLDDPGAQLEAVRLWERLDGELGIRVDAFVRGTEFGARAWVAAEVEVAPALAAITDAVGSTELLWRPENLEVLVEE